VLRDRARRAARLAADLQTLLLGSGADGQKGARESDRLILIDEAAKMLATSEDTLYSKWKRLPFAFKDPLDGKIKFRVSGIEGTSPAGRAGVRVDMNTASCILFLPWHPKDAHAKRGNG
jgi:hypothetical protein